MRFAKSLVLLGLENMFVCWFMAMLAQANSKCIHVAPSMGPRFRSQHEAGYLNPGRPAEEVQGPVIFVRV